MKKIISYNDESINIIERTESINRQDETNKRMFSFLDKYKDDFKNELSRFDKMWNKEWE